MKSVDELPDEITRRLALARVQVERGTALPLQFRYVMSILAVFGPRWHIPEIEAEVEGWKEVEDEVFLSPIRGWQRRAWNALLCAQKVTPQWNPQLIPVSIDMWRPNEIEGLYTTDLNQIIRKAKSAVKDVAPFMVKYTVPVPPVQIVIEEASSLGYQELHLNRAAFAYSAVESARWIVCHDEYHEFEMDEEYPLHWTGDWTGILSVYSSSSAFSIETYDKNVRDFVKDKERLKEFWLWWLDEAVPASWDLRDL